MILADGMVEDVGYFDDDEAEKDESHVVEDYDKMQPKKYNLKDRSADHRGEGIRRSESQDHTGAVLSFRAALKFSQDGPPQLKGDSMMNLGVGLMRLGNSMGRDAAKHHYYEALQLFNGAKAIGLSAASDNADAIHENCRLRWELPCSKVFVEYEGGSIGDDEEPDEFKADDDFPEDDEASPYDDAEDLAADMEEF